MAENRIYDSLLSLPLFLGMSRCDLQEAAGKTKFDFKKFSEGKLIVAEGEPCKHIYFLLDGDICVTTEADDHGYRIEEDITAPEIFQPECIFGLSQRFTHTYTAKKDCSTMCIDKQDVLKLADNQEIFRLNLLNFISAHTQKHNRRILRVPPKSLQERIVRFLESRCIRPAGEKTFYIKMTRIAEELNDSRLDISRALNKLQDKGLLTLQRGRIHIEAMENLIHLHT